MAPSDNLIEAVTRQVMAELGGGSGKCGDCKGSCAAECSDKVHSVVGQGACRISYNGAGARVPSELGQYIDHTLLAPGTTAEEIDKLCDEAIQYRFAAVCVNPVWVRRATQRLRGKSVAVACVVGFPLGANSTEIKVMEARRALREGAKEIDMVINIGALKGGDHRLVQTDIARVAETCREVGAASKVIIEAGMLTDQEKVVASRLSQLARADFVKTSTGFGHGGATLFDVALIRETVGPEMGIKASGGVKTADEANQMIAAGATRIGASAGIQIVSGQKGGAGGGY